MVLSAFYFDSAPLYRHDPPRAGSGAGAAGLPGLGGIARHWPPASPSAAPSRWLPLAWALVTLLHIALNLTWKVVGRAGVGAVTWGVSPAPTGNPGSAADTQGLIVALGSVFAGLGAWGGLV